MALLPFDRTCHRLSYRVINIKWKDNYILPVYSVIFDLCLSLGSRLKNHNLSYKYNPAFCRHYKETISRIKKFSLLIWITE